MPSFSFWRSPASAVMPFASPFLQFWRTWHCLGKLEMVPVFDPSFGSTFLNISTRGIIVAIVLWRLRSSCVELFWKRHSGFGNDQWLKQTGLVQTATAHLSPISLHHDQAFIPRPIQLVQPWQLWAHESVQIPSHATREPVVLSILCRFCFGKSFEASMWHCNCRLSCWWIATVAFCCKSIQSSTCVKNPQSQWNKKQVWNSGLPAAQKVLSCGRSKCTAAWEKKKTQSEKSGWLRRKLEDLFCCRHCVLHRMWLPCPAPTATHLTGTTWASLLWERTHTFWENCFLFSLSKLKPSHPF